MLHGYFTFQQGRSGCGRQILKATITPYGRVRLVMDDGGKRTARVRRDTLVTPWLVMMRFELDASWLPVSLLLTPAIISEEQLRQLRVLLRYGEIKQTEPRRPGSI
jgi:hypothetical protein